MPKISKKLCIWILSVSILLPLLSATVLADNSKISLPYFELPVTVKTVTVGLRSDNSTLSEASLQNKVGSGYGLGFYDLTRSFKSFGYINNNAISLHADIGFSVSDSAYVGPYHISLSYYYSDFSAAKASADSIGGFPAYINGRYKVLVGAFKDAQSAQKTIEKRKFDADVFTGSSSSLLICDSSTANVLFMYDNYGRNLSIKPVSEDQQAETWLAGNYYRGGFEFLRSGNGINVINYVDLESYVSGVLPYEMSGDWPIEALKAQAVCARTYAINNINSYAANGYDVRSDTYSQVYRGVTDSTDTTAKAAADTANEFARYKGAICKVYYMSSDGGMTESGENTFKQRRAYLSAVEDPFEREIEHYNEDWEVAFTPYELQCRINNRGSALSQISDVVTVNSDAGNVIGLTFVDADGNEASVFNVDCYKLLGLNSINYTVEKEIRKVPIQEDKHTQKNKKKSQSETEEVKYREELFFVFKGHGWGHNCGMSQWGAFSMAKYFGKSYDDIIKYYFSGAYIK